MLASRMVNNGGVARRNNQIITSFNHMFTMKIDLSLIHPASDQHTDGQTENLPKSSLCRSHEKIGTPGTSIAAGSHGRFDVGPLLDSWVYDCINYGLWMFMVVICSYNHTGS